MEEPIYEDTNVVKEISKEEIFTVFEINKLYFERMVSIAYSKRREEYEKNAKPEYEIKVEKDLPKQEETAENSLTTNDEQKGKKGKIKIKNIKEALINFFGKEI